MALHTQNKEVLKKVQKMQEKTDHILITFGIPDTEKVIQDYHCSLNASLLQQGQMYITQNYIIFEGSKASEVIPFQNVISVVHNKGLISKTIDIETTQGKFVFGSFVHREECFHLLEHLFEHSPTYVYLDKDGGPLQSSTSNAGEFQDDDDYGGGYTDTGVSQHKAQQQEYEKVDLASGNQALAKAAELRALGAATLSEIEDQAVMIDRVGRDMDEVKNYLDHGDRVIDGIESVAGQIKNAVTLDRYGKGLGAFEAPDRQISLDDEEFTDIPILLKLPNDSLVPSTLRFGAYRFFATKDDMSTERKGYGYDYERVASAVIRARHQHLDIRFRDGTKRFRMCSSYIQAVVNELVLRTRQINVVFEPGTKEFAYGSIELRGQMMSGSRSETSGGTGQFITRRASLVDMVSQDVDAQTRSDLEQQEDQLDEVAGAVSELGQISRAMGAELDRQIHQLDDIHNVTDKSNKKAHKNAYRVNRMVPG